MKLYEPCFAAQFHCLAGACPDTCCKDWEIILDEKTLARYRALPGVFGDEVRNALTTDAEGDTMFPVVLRRSLPRAALARRRSPL